MHSLNQQRLVFISQVALLTALSLTNLALALEITADFF